MNYRNIELLGMDDTSNIVCKKHSFVQKNIHWHTYYEIELAIAGKGTHKINGTVYPFQPGDVFLLRPSDFHEFDLEEKGTTYLIEIPPSHLPKEIVDLLMVTSDNLILHFPEEKFTVLRDIFLLIEKHNLEKKYVDTLITEYLLCSLLLIFIEQINNGILNSTYKTSNRLREIMFYIQKNFRQNITLDSISESFYISKEYLCSLFKSGTGMSVTSYIRKLRLNHAAKLAATTNLKSIEISESCGFNSVATFLRNFKNEYGVSPLQMRENAKNSTK